MKIEENQQPFNPIIITIESQEELDTLFICLKIKNDAFTKLLQYNSHEAKYANFVTSQHLHNTLYTFYNKKK